MSDDGKHLRCREFRLYREGWWGVWGEEGGKKIGLDCYGRLWPVLAGNRRICKPPLSLERCVVFWKIWTPFVGPKAVSPRKTHGFGRARVWSCFSKGPQKTHWCALSPFGLPRATFKATTKNTALRRDWRSVGGLFGPKWAWHSRRVHIFKRLVFSSFSRIHAIRRVLRSLGGSWASPGTLWGGARGPTTRPRSRPL